MPLVTAPQDNPFEIENYLRVTALLYLFIGLFIFARRWNAPRAIHFYVFCLVSFILYSFHYSGKLNSFDWTIYWGNVVALLLQPALLVHFALVFPLAPPGALDKVGGRLHRAAGAADGPHFRGHRVARFSAGDQQPRNARHDRAGLPGTVFPARGRNFPGQLSARAERHPAAATEMGDWRGVRGHSAIFAAVHPAALREHRAAIVDEVLGLLAGADPAVLRLRHHSLPADGRGHHFQARAGVHVRDRRRGGDLFFGDRAGRRVVRTRR